MSDELSAFVVLKQIYRLEKAITSISAMKKFRMPLPRRQELLDDFWNDVDKWEN